MYFAEQINLSSVQVTWSNYNIYIEFHRNMSKHSSDTCKGSIRPMTKVTKTKLKWMINVAAII
jgi:hypothetical protein